MAKQIATSPVSDYYRRWVAEQQALEAPPFRSTGTLPETQGLLRAPAKGLWREGLMHDT